MQTPADGAESFELAGVGSPIVDLTAQVPESFLAHIAGGKGGMVLVDDAEMGRILSLLKEPTSLSTGGSAANATFNACRLGLKTTFIGKLGNDAFAAAFVERFQAAGVDSTRFKRGSSANARCLALVTPDAQRTMRTCLGAAMTLSPAEITPADFAGVRHAHIEGYLVFNEALCTQVLNCARAAGCTISLDLSSYEVVNATRPWMLAQLGRGIDVVFANEDEIRALYPGRPADYEALARELASNGVIAAVKLGADGAWIARGSEVHRIAGVRVDEVVDTNGAGDAWAAGFLFGHVRGLPLARCGAIASVMGAETVRHVGPLIPEEAWEAAQNAALAAAT
ncbi:MAG TPA: adenosine kinase [Opitutaceae bacterium]|jgi:sugar/nucleoside kinase (ribokinase family)